MADWQEIIGALFVLFSLVFWVINQIREAKKQPPGPRNQPPQPQRRPPQANAQAPAAGPPNPAGQQADPLRDQVQEFLRRAQQQQPANRQRPPAGPPRQRETREIEILVADDRDQQEPRTIAEPLRPLPQPAAVGSRPTGLRPVGRRSIADAPRTSVADHVAEHISAGTQSVASHTSQLGQRIISDDEQFDLQLKAKFDHTLGSLSVTQRSDQQPPAGPAGATPAGQITALLTSPGGVQQAIIINEILRPPTERW